MGNNLDSLYMMMTKHVDMLVSDSGVTKYRMISPVWYIYDRRDKKEWYFPKGLKVTSLDTISTKKVSLTADTATYYTIKNIWDLRGHVHFVGGHGRQLFTPHLTWDKDQRKLYSNDSTYLIMQGRILRGNRFTAKDDLSEYSIYNNSGIFDVDKVKLNTTKDSIDNISKDSIYSNSSIK